MPRPIVTSTTPGRAYGRDSSQTTFQELLDDKPPSSAVLATPNVSSMKEKEYLVQIKELSDLLAESETTIQRLVEQEKVG